MTIEQVMIQLGATDLKSSGGVGGEGWQPPTMMIKKIMIQLGQKIREVARGLGGPHGDRTSDDSIRGKQFNKYGGVWGAAAPAMMIEKLMIQLGARNLNNQRGGKKSKTSP